MSRYKVRKQALETLSNIENNPQNYYLIHYACGNFREENTISVIAVMNLKKQVSTTFSIKKTAEDLNINPRDISKNTLKIQKEMLESFNEFLIQNVKNIKWINWNMQSDKFGFEAIQHQSKVLNIKNPVTVSNSEQINLSHLLSDIYGPNFIDDPKMEKLAEYNDIDLSYEFKNGKEEAKLLNEGKYTDISLSTIRKLTIFNIFLEKAINNKLKVKSKWTDIYGWSPQGIYNAIKGKWWFAILTFILGTLIGHFFK